MRILPRTCVAACVVLFLVDYAHSEEVYFGNLHGHTSYSDGSGKPADAFKYARDNGHLDFLAITEHNHKQAESGAKERKDGILIATDHALYDGTASSSLISAAARYTKDGTFVALYGQEFSTISSGNHANVFDAPHVIEVANGDFKALRDWVDAHPDSNGKPPLIQFNHPGLFREDAKEYGKDDFGSEGAWVAALDPHVGLIEILNGPAMSKEKGVRSSEVQEKDYFQYLNRGFHLAPTTGQDNHYVTFGTVTDARTAVVADHLTKRDILEGLRARHVYATEDKNLRIVFRANGQLMGDIAPAPAVGSDIALTVSIKDDDEPDAHYHIEIYTDTIGGEAAKDPIDVAELDGDTNGAVPLEGVVFQGPGQFILIKVIQSSDDNDDDRAWTAPIWFGGGAANIATSSGLRILSLLPNPAGRDEDDESVTLRNNSNGPINLSRWSLRDLSGQRWALTAQGSLNANTDITIKRNGQPMSLNNNGDTIELLDPNENVVQVLRYGQVRENEEVRP